MGQWASPEQTSTEHSTIRNAQFQLRDLVLLNGKVNQKDNAETEPIHDTSS
jgi:hypothetical protein